MPVIDSLIAELGFDFDNDDLEKFNKGFADAGKLLAGFIGLAVSAQAAISAFTAKIAESNDATGKFAQRTGIALDTLQELGFVAELNGGSIDSMNSSLANLSRTAAESSKGMGANVETFGMLGISVTDADGKLKDTSSLLDDVSDAIAGLGSQAERLEFAQKLGIGEDLLLSIQDGSDALAAQKKEARELGFVIDQDAAKAAADFNDNMLRMTKIIQGVSSAIGTKLMKNAKPMVDMFIEWFKINKKIISQNLTAFLEKVSDATSVVFNVLTRVWGIIDTLAKGFGGWRNTILLVAGAMAILNASTLLIPVLTIAAGAAILLMLEDVQKFAEGGDSALGDLINRFPALEKPLRGLLELVGLIGSGWAMIFGPEGKEALEGVSMMIDDIADTTREILENLGLIEEKKTGFGADTKGRGLFDEGIDYPGKNKNTRSFGNLVDAVSGLFRGQAIDPYTAIAPASQSPTTSNRTSNNKTIININGGNPAEVESTVKRVLNNEYMGAETDLRTPVDM